MKCICVSCLYAAQSGLRIPAQLWPVTDWLMCRLCRVNAQAESVYIETMCKGVVLLVVLTLVKSGFWGQFTKTTFCFELHEMPRSTQKSHLCQPHKPYAEGALQSP